MTLRVCKAGGYFQWLQQGPATFSDLDKVGWFGDFSGPDSPKKALSGFFCSLSCSDGLFAILVTFVALLFV